MVIILLYFKRRKAMQDDILYHKIVKRITKLNIKYLKEYNEKIFNISKDSVSNAKLENCLRHLVLKLDFNKTVLNKIMNMYLIQKSDMFNIKQQLFYYVNNAKVVTSDDKENQEATRKILNYLFRK